MALRLEKDQPVALVNTAGRAVTRLFVGAKSDASTGDRKGFLGSVRRRAGVDLDLVAIAFDDEDQAVRVCGSDTLVLYEGALAHSGDDRTGRRPGVNESVHIDLTRLPSNIRTVVVALNAFKPGVSFADTAGADCVLIDESAGPGEELGAFSIPINDRSKSTVILAKVTRDPDGGGWKVTEVDTPGDAGDRDALLRLAGTYVRRPA